MAAEFHGDGGGRVHRKCLGFCTRTSFPNAYRLGGIRLGLCYALGSHSGEEHDAIVGQLTNPQDLVLSQSSITDAALETLQGLSRLTTIYLADTPVTNAGIPAIARLRSLKIIDLSGTKVTGNWLAETVGEFSPKGAKKREFNH